MTARRLRRLLSAIAALFAIYTLLLLGAGVFASGVVRDRMRDRLAEALDAEVTITHFSVNLITGRASLEGLHVERSEGGTVRIDTQSAEVEFARFGAVLWDDELRAVSLRGVAIEISAAGAAALKRRSHGDGSHRPLRTRHFTLDDGTLAVMATSLMPELGRVEVAIQHAEVDSADLSSAVSWLSRLARLEATVTARGVTLGTQYDGKTLTLTGSLFGSQPLSLPLEMPALDPGDYEPVQLRELILHLTTQVGPAMAKRALKQKLLDKLKN